MIDRLAEKIEKTKAPIVVGLDPTLALVPPFLLQQAFAEHGETLEGAAEAFLTYNKGIVDAVCDLVPAVKPQIAMYEQLGLPGLRVFKETIDYCHGKGLLVIGDVKRGDIGSTSGAYAAAHLGEVKIGKASFAPFDEDFATVNPYLGTDGIAPFVKECKAHGKGIFVLVKTSNPSSGEFQDRLLDGAPLYERVGEKVEEWGQDTVGSYGYSLVGAVVGATYPEMGRRLREKMPHTFFLVPGYGAQGGKGKDLASFFDQDGRGVIVNSSRGIIAAYQQEAYASYGQEGYAEAARAAVLAMREDLNQALEGRR